MSGQKSRRQSLRQALLLISFLAFPLTLNYFSPYIIIAGPSEGIINGSFIVFGHVPLGILPGPALVRMALPGRGLTGGPLRGE